jgi:hypothetical protein
MKTLQELQKEMQNFRINLTSENYDETVKQMQEIDKQIKAVKVTDLLNNVNSKQKRRREAAAQAWECEQPGEDITTNIGDFHKVKVKKFPKLEALKYVSAKFENNFLYVLHVNGEKFTMYEKKYNGDQPPTYSRPASFAEFLQLNNISPKDITAQEFTEISNKIKEANEEVKKQIETYSAKMNSLNAYSLECWNLISKRAEHVYLYHTNQ